MEPHKDPQQFNFIQTLWGAPLLGLFFRGVRKALGRILNRFTGEARLDYETKRQLDDIGRAATSAAIDASSSLAEMRVMAKDNREWMENMRMAVKTSLDEAHEKSDRAALEVAELRGRFEGLERKVYGNH